MQHPNYGYIGIPLVILAFGDQAALPIGLILVADTITLLTLTAFFVAGNELGPTAISMKMLQTVATNPLVLAVIAGITFSSTELLMPKLPDVFLNMLWSGNTSCTVRTRATLANLLKRHQRIEYFNSA